MAFEWTEKENKRNIIYAEDINSMAREVIRLEEDKANKSNSLFGYGIEDAYTTKEADETFAKKSTTLKGYGIEDAYTKEECDGKFAFKETIYTKSEIDEKIKADITPTENSTNLITSGGVYEALQNSGGTKEFIVTATALYDDEDNSYYLTDISANFLQIKEAYNNGTKVSLKINMENGTISMEAPLCRITDLQVYFSVYTEKMLFEAVIGEDNYSFVFFVKPESENNKLGFRETPLYELSNLEKELYPSAQYTAYSLVKLRNEVNDYINIITKNVTEVFTSFDEQLSDKPTYLDVEEMIDTAIGDIEASLENIINKYGLGGEA